MDGFAIIKMFHVFNSYFPVRGFFQKKFYFFGIVFSLKIVGGDAENYKAHFVGARNHRLLVLTKWVFCFGAPHWWRTHDNQTNCRANGML